MEFAKITAKGQLTLPAKVRRKMKVGPGNQLVFIETDNGFLILDEKTVESNSMIKEDIG